MLLGLLYMPPPILRFTLMSLLVCVPIGVVSLLGPARPRARCAQPVVALLAPAPRPPFKVTWPRAVVVAVRPHRTALKFVFGF